MPSPTPINEFSSFTETHTFGGNITNITITPSIPNGIIYTTTPTSFTVSSGNAEMFDRTIEYLDSNDALQSISRFANLPAEYHAITRYVGAAVGLIEFSITVTTDENDPILLVPPKVYDPFVYNLISNYTNANQMLKQKVAEGTY